MDNLDAPQWADFIAPSPQVSMDDFFQRKHEGHEYKMKSNNVDYYSPNRSIRQPLNESFANQTIFDKTPKCVKSFKTPVKKTNKINETVDENSLTDVMNKMQLSVKSVKGEKSINKSCLVDSPSSCLTPMRLTRSMCAKAATPKCDFDESHYHSLDQDDFDNDLEYKSDENDKENVCSSKSENNDENEKINEHEIKSPNELTSVEENTKKSNVIENINENIENNRNSVVKPTSNVNLEEIVSSDKNDTTNEKSEVNSQAKEDTIVQENENKQVLKSKIVTSFNLQATSKNNNSLSKKNASTLTGNARNRQTKRRQSILNQQRLSLTKALTVNKYVSMAEAISNFQRVTPQRFHTVNVKTTKTEILRKKSLKLTKATSPALMCKKRTRPVKALSRDEQEKLDLEKLRLNQIKANPVPKDILKKPVLLKKMDKKITNPEPFNFTFFKKYQPTQSQSIQNQDVKKNHRLPVKTGPSITSSNDKEVIVKEEEILHYGIPLDPVNKKKKTTQIIPFSFEERNRILQARKQEKLKILQKSEQEKIKPEFHARPVPAAVKTPCNKQPVLKSASANNNMSKKITIPRLLSFEERNKQIQKNKEEKIKQMLEEEKKMRTFKAQKVPEFKPVLVKGTSRDNLLKKSTENLVSKSQNNNGSLKKLVKKVQGIGKSIDFSAMQKKSSENIPAKNFIKKSIPVVAPKKITTASVVTENKKKNNASAIPKILEPKCKLSQKSVSKLSELNTDKRAKERKEFEEQMKKKEIDELELKNKEEKERLEREKIENIELRKKLLIKAKPMPVYKHLNIAKSTKTLTDAQSPHWSRPKTTSSLH